MTSAGNIGSRRGSRFGAGARWFHPTRLVVVAFVSVALVGTLALWLPIATEEGTSADFTDALFTAVSALSVTGLVVVDTSTHWSGFGTVVILLLIQLGGFGITTFASLFGVLVFRRLGLRTRLSTQVELNELELGGVGSLVRRVAVFYMVVETAGFLLLTGAMVATTDVSLGDSAWFGLFHSVSAFNNAGFSTYSDNLVGFAANPMVLGIVGGLIVAGGIGFPVVLDVTQQRRWARWSLHTKMVLSATAVLLVAGALAITAFEWSNPDTFGAMAVPERIVNGVFGSVTARTAGFNSIDYGAASEPTLLTTQALMFIGAAPGSAAGGIKVTTFALLGYVIWSELRGEADVNVFGRRVAERTQRQALSVALVGVGLAVSGTLALAAATSLELGDVAFEAVSALATVGLSTGVTADLPVPGRLVLVVLMVLGRLGPTTVGVALVLRSRERLYRYPEGRPLIG